MVTHCGFVKRAVPFLSLLTLPAASWAVDWSFSARAETGAQYYHFEQSPIIAFNQPLDLGNSFTGTGTITQGKTDYSAWMPILGVGFSVVADRFFLDAAYQGTYNGSSDSDGTGIQNFAVTNPAYGSNAVGLYQDNQTYNQDANLDRWESSVSLGYGVTDNFAVFAGWKWASTDFEVRESGTEEVDAISAVSNLEFVPLPVSYTGKLKYDFAQNGPFIGAAYQWQFDQGLKGSLTVNAALAFLSGEIKDRKSSAITTYDDGSTGPSSLVAPAFKGDTTAITLGVSWRGETGVKGLSYLLGVNGYSYNFDADSLHGDGFNGTDGGDITETVLNFKVGIAYVF
jgi:hypothetical protein